MRIHLFEWEDQPWFPDVLRRAMTDYLRFAIVKLNFYGAAVPVLQNLIAKTGATRVIDLCTGGGGGVPVIEPQINKGQTGTVKFLLTDLYPNEDAAALFADNPNVEYVKEPVNAVNVPPEFTGVRTLFSSFHHFKPDLAQQILADAARQGQPIAIFDESADYKPLKLLALLIVPLMVLLMMPFIKPFRLSRIIFTYLIPLLPLLILWDGFVSILRMYSEQELQQLVQQISSPGYHWETGKVGKQPQQIQYLIGWKE